MKSGKRKAKFEEGQVVQVISRDGELTVGSFAKIMGTYQDPDGFQYEVSASGRRKIDGIRQGIYLYFPEELRRLTKKEAEG